MYLFSFHSWELIIQFVSCGLMKLDETMLLLVPNFYEVLLSLVCLYIPCIVYFPPQEITAFARLFDEGILQKYQSNDISKADMSEVISKTSQDNFVATMNHFRSAMKALFDTPVLTFLQNIAEDMRSIYTQILKDSINGEYYYGSKIDLRKQGRGLQMWRIPVRVTHLLQILIVAVITSYSHAYMHTIT